MNTTFRTLLNEAQLTYEMLGAGATQVGKAGYATKGIYFQAFTSLATGLERIGKLCLMLDYYIDNDGQFPDLMYLKDEIGHDLEALYLKSQELIDRRSIQLEYINKFDDEIHLNIFNILSGFAKGDRYSNIDLLVGSHRSVDSMALWFNLVDNLLFERRVTDKKKEKIANNARVIEQFTRAFSMVLFTSETGEEMNQVEDASFRTGMMEAVRPLRQLYVIQIIRYWAEILCELQYKATGLGKQDVPHMNEFLGLFRCDNAYIRTRKTWDTV